MNFGSQLQFATVTSCNCYCDLSESRLRLIKKKEVWGMDAWLGNAISTLAAVTIHSSLCGSLNKRWSFKRL
jgi:hypothetical protein